MLEVHGPERARQRVAQRKQHPRCHGAEDRKLGADDDVAETEQRGIEQDREPPRTLKQRAAIVVLR